MTKKIFSILAFLSGVLLLGSGLASFDFGFRINSGILESLFFPALFGTIIFGYLSFSGRSGEAGKESGGKLGRFIFWLGVIIVAILVLWMVVLIFEGNLIFMS